MSMVRQRSRMGIWVCGLIVGASSIASAQPTIRALAVKKNGVAIVPRASSITAVVGDEIEAEFWVEGWSPVGQALRAFQITLDSDQLVPDVAGECGGLVPVGVVTPDYNCACFEDQDCVGCGVASATACYEVASHCAGPGHNAALGASIQQNHFEVIGKDVVNTYVFAPAFGSPPIDFAALDLTLPDYRYGATLLNGLDAKVYTVPRYAATLKFVVTASTAGANGVFRVAMLRENFAGGTAVTFLTDEFGQAIPLPPATLTLVPLTVRVTGSCVVVEDPCLLSAVEPLNCSIDARQPSNPDGSNAQGWNFIDLEFDMNPDSLGVNSFTTREVPAGQVPVVSSLEPRDGNVLRLHLGSRIRTGRWTCVSYNEPGCPDPANEICIGHLPADVSNDRTSAAPDILFLIDCLNGVRVCQIYQCDIDRSNVCGPPDILRTIDLLNGAAMFDPWLNVNIPACPSP